jgi:RNA recognition motif-containing protein
MLQKREKVEEKHENVEEKPESIEERPENVEDREPSGEEDRRASSSGSSSSDIFTVFVGDLNEYIDEDDLRAVYSKCGPIHSVSVIKDRRTGASKLYGFINFANPEAQRVALRDYAVVPIKVFQLNSLSFMHQGGKSHMPAFCQSNVAFHFKYPEKHLRR